MFKYLPNTLIIYALFSAGISSAETKVFFTNNTFDKITIEYPEKSDINAIMPVWTRGPIEVNPYSTVTLMSIPDETMLLGSKFYFYAAMTMTERSWNQEKPQENKFGAGLMMQASDKTNTSKPNLISAASFTGSYNNIKSWYTTGGATSTFSSSDAIGSRTYALDFHFGDNPESIVYTLKETGVTTDSKVLTVLQYNIQQRPEMEGLFRSITGGHSLRSDLSVNYLPPAIKQFNADVVTVNEAFTKVLRPLLVENMKTIGYPYATRVLNGDGMAMWSGGVMVFSKYPITKTAEYIFTHYASADKDSDKGVLYVQINKNGQMKYNIFATHTNASYTFGDKKLPEDDPGRVARNGDLLAEKEFDRSGQFKEINDFIKTQNIPSTEPVIIVGDMNVDMLSEKGQENSEYDQMLTALDAIHPKISDKSIPYTFNFEANEWVSLDDGPKQYLDYILYSKAYLMPKFSTNRAICLKSDGHFYNADKCSKSQNEIKKTLGKSRRDLSDHFPVLGVFDFNN